MRLSPPVFLIRLIIGPPRGRSSVAPTPAPCFMARSRSASVAPAANALSLASPLPAVTAVPNANGIPIPGINAGAYVPATDPNVSPNLPTFESSKPMSGCIFRCTP